MAPKTIVSFLTGEEYISALIHAVLLKNRLVGKGKTKTLVESFENDKGELMRRVTVTYDSDDFKEEGT